MKHTNMISERWGLLWQDRRSWKIRLPLTVFCAFACAFTFIIFGPCEIYAQNIQEMSFPFSTLLKIIVPAGIAVFITLLVILLFLRGKIYNFTVSFLFAGTLAGYLQGNIWNIYHGVLNGDSINWRSYQLPMLKNCVVWLCVFIVVFLLLYFSRRIWTKSLKLICGILIGAQMIALFSIGLRKGFENHLGTNTQYVTRDGIYEVSPGKNIIVFLLDCCDRSAIDELLLIHPEWNEYLNGFTNYQDFTGSYSRTNPSITYLLTGEVQTFSEPWPDYFRKAWSGSTLVSDIHNEGYDTKVYTNCTYVFGEAENVQNIVDNVHDVERTVNYWGLGKKMLCLSAYRYAPEAMKPYFQIYSGELESVISSTSAFDQNAIYLPDDSIFWSEFRNHGGLDIGSENKDAFIFYHLVGAHAPWTIDENANPVSGDTQSSKQQQLTGNFRMIFQYFDDLKEKGLYDDATIIITTDHAQDFPNGFLSELDSPRMLPLLIKPSETNLDEPMRISNKQVCQDNLRASIVAYAGLNSSDYGRTLESIGESEEMTRYFWMQAYDEATKEIRDSQNVTYEITGNANDFSNWRVVDITPIVYKMG